MRRAFEVFYHPSLIAFTAALLVADAHTKSRWPQYLLGVVTLGVLLLVARRHSPEERREMWWCVGVSTVIELACTQGWGLYGYKFGNLPLYVPPGHGLVFLFSLSGARAGWIARRPRAFARAILVAATAWGLAGLVLFPRFGGALDVHGALYWPFFATLLVRSERRATYAVTFLFTSVLELVGTRLELWHWSPIMPGLGFSAADPPSVVAGGYCFFAVLAGWLASRRAVFDIRRLVPRY